MKRNWGFLLVPAMLLAFVMTAGCSSSAKTFADPLGADTSWLRIGYYIYNNALNDKDDFQVEYFDGEEVEWEKNEVIAITPGEHTIVAESKFGAVQMLFTAAPLSYYRLDMYINIEGLWAAEDKVKKELVIVDETGDVLHGVGQVYVIFRDAEKKAGATRLSSGVELIRAPDEKALYNFGVHDLSAEPASLVTLKVNAKDGVLTVTKFDDQAVDWYGHKGSGIILGSFGGGLIRIPSGQHTLTASYRSERGAISFYSPTPGLRQSQGIQLASGAFGLLEMGISAIDKAVKEKQAEKRDTDNIQLTYDFSPGAEYELIFIKDPSKNGSYAAVEIIPGKGAPSGQRRERGFVSETVTSNTAEAEVQSTAGAATVSGPYFVSVNDLPGGPYSVDELKQLAREAKLTKDSLVWKEGMAAWTKAGTIAEFASVFAAVPPPLPPAGQAVPAASPPPLPGKAAPPPLAKNSPPPVSEAAYRVGGKGPSGGVVFYDKGNNNDGWRYLEAAPQDIDQFCQWGVYREHVFTTAKIGEGKQNTQSIIAQLAKRKEKDRAAQLCDSFSAGGFDDWFLPSRDELDALYKVMKGNNLLGGFKQNWYWTSTQEGKKNAYIIHMGSGKHDGTDKDHRNYIRPVRAF